MAAAARRAATAASLPAKNPVSSDPHHHPRITEILSPSILLFSSYAQPPSPFLRPADSSNRQADCRRSPPFLSLVSSLSAKLSGSSSKKKPPSSHPSLSLYQNSPQHSQAPTSATSSWDAESAAYQLTPDSTKNTTQK